MPGSEIHFEIYSPELLSEGGVWNGEELGLQSSWYPQYGQVPSVRSWTFFVFSSRWVPINNCSTSQDCIAFCCSLNLLARKCSSRGDWSSGLERSEPHCKIETKIYKRFSTSVLCAGACLHHENVLFPSQHFPSSKSVVLFSLCLSCKKQAGLLLFLKPCS